MDQAAAGWGSIIDRPTPMQQHSLPEFDKHAQGSKWVALTSAVYALVGETSSFNTAGGWRSGNGPSTRETLVLGSDQDRYDDGYTRGTRA